MVFAFRIVNEPNITIHNNALFRLGELSKMPYLLTPEQNEIVRTDLKHGEILKIIAFAGTGKTTTLFEKEKIPKTY